MQQPYQMQPADAAILKDSSHYRVFDVSGDPFNTGRTSYFHNALGGYHGAKPGRIQDLYDFYIAQNNMKVLNMLNVKYFIIPTEQGNQAQQNPEAFGNAWYVKNIKWVEDANEEILSLEDVNLQETAVVNKKFKNSISENIKYDDSAKIELISQKPNELKYKTTVNSPQLAVFSETYYQPGWQAYLDGKPVEHAQANYVLRTMNIPAGSHNITFKFEPKVIETGSTIALISSIILVLIVIGGVGYRVHKTKK